MLRTGRTAVLAIGLIAAASLSPARALEQVQIGQLYTVHTVSAGPCPALDWHFVVDAKRAMMGYLVCALTNRTATLSGTLDPDDSFHMLLTEEGGSRQARAAGKFTSQFVTISIDGNASVCDRQNFRIVVVHAPGNEGGGG